MCNPGISERDRGYFKGISYSPAFHVSPFCRPSICLQDTYANFYDHSNLLPDGFSVSVHFNPSPFLYFARIPLYLAIAEILRRASFFPAWITLSDICLPPVSPASHAPARHSSTDKLALSGHILSHICSTWSAKENPLILISSHPLCEREVVWLYHSPLPLALTALSTWSTQSPSAFPSNNILQEEA